MWRKGKRVQGRVGGVESKSLELSVIVFLCKLGCRRTSMVLCLNECVCVCSCVHVSKYVCLHVGLHLGMRMCVQAICTLVLACVKCNCMHLCF